MKLLRRVQIYLVIPLSIALLVHLQVIPLEMVFRNIETSDKSINFKVIAELAFMSYFIFYSDNTSRPHLSKNESTA